MTPKIVRLNAPALYALGMDRPTVEALLNALRITGNETDSVTVPDLSEQVDDNDALIQEIQQKVVIIQMSTDILEQAPAPQYASIVRQVEHMESEVRQLAEQVAMLTRAFEIDMRPLSDQFMTFSNQIITETRHLADQQTINTNQIQEIKQGTML